MSRYHNILIALTLTAFSACSDSQLEGWEPYLSTGQQEPVSTPVSVDQTSISVESASTTSVINVTASGQWTVSSAAAWISLSNTSGAGDASITLTITENKTPDTRTGTVTIQNSAGSVKVTLTQNGKTLSVTPESLSFGADGGSETVSVTTDGTFTTSTSDNWITVSSDGNTITVKTSGNTSTSTRSGIVTVSLSNLTSGSLSTTIAVSQDGATQQTVQHTFTVNSVSFTMIRIDGGTFTMGATEEQGNDAYDNEKPAHQVTLSTYYIGETEVTQELWQAVMGRNPSYFKGNERPVESVRWNECYDFINKLNALTGKSFRLPTEAEREYAARGGNRSRGYKYSGSNNLGNVAWYEDNSESTTHDVAQKLQNELGLYDMSGNVWEWCSDWYGSYSSSSQTNPQGPSSGLYCVYRGGSWNFNAWFCRSSYRDYYAPGSWDRNLGLRLVLSE